MKEIESGVWGITDAQPDDERTEQTGTPGVTVTSRTIHLGGWPPARARNHAIAELIRHERDVTTGLPHGQSTDSARVTVLAISEAGAVTAYEGVALEHQNEPVLRKKRSSTKAWRLGRMDVLSAVAGYNGQDALLQQWQAAAELVPELVEVDVAAVPEMTLDDPESPPLSAACLFTHPGFGGFTDRVHGCLFVATDRQTEASDLGDTIVNGYFWCPFGSELEREHGSFTVSQLRSWGGMIRDFGTSLTFGDFVRGNTPLETTDVYQALVQRQPSEVS